MTNEKAFSTLTDFRMKSRFIRWVERLEYVPVVPSYRTLVRAAQREKAGAELTPYQQTLQKLAAEFLEHTKQTRGGTNPRQKSRGEGK